MSSIKLFKWDLGYCRQIYRWTPKIHKKFPPFIQDNIVFLYWFLSDQEYVFPRETVLEIFKKITIPMNYYLNGCEYYNMFSEEGI